MWGITETERKRYAKQARQKRDKTKEAHEAAVWRGRDLSEARDPMMEALRPMLSRLYRSGSKSATMVIEFTYTDKKENKVNVKLAIPHAQYTKKSLTEWLEDSTAFFVDGVGSIFSVSMKDWKLMVAALKGDTATETCEYDPRDRRHW